jgi:hypothetical protein
MRCSYRHCSRGYRSQALRSGFPPLEDPQKPPTELRQ